MWAGGSSWGAAPAGPTGSNPSVEVAGPTSSNPSVEVAGPTSSVHLGSELPRPGSERLSQRVLGGEERPAAPQDGCGGRVRPLYAAQHESFSTSRVKVWAASFRASAMVR